MEILIPGLLLVALMVYLSTRIKRTAAEAFAEERIETDDFLITKPDDFIIPVKEESSFAFAAYSKDFGADDADEIRQVSAELMIYENDSLEHVRSSICTEDVKVVSDQRLIGNAEILEIESVINGIGVESEHRLVEKNGKVFHLAISALADTKEEQQRNIDTLLASFEVK
jgi:hypothetical protein